jgi:hypothetical protein
VDRQQLQQQQQQQGLLSHLQLLMLQVLLTVGLRSWQLQLLLPELGVGWQIEAS